MTGTPERNPHVFRPTREHILAIVIATGIALMGILWAPKYLAWLLKRFNGNQRLALASYNAGEMTVDKYNGIPPYKETQNYVVKITGYYNRYAARMGGDPQAVGTLDPRDMVIAETSNLSDAAMGYAAVSMNTMHC